MADYLTRRFFDGVYIPAGLLIFGVFIVKREFTLYAAALALLLGAGKFFTMCMLDPLGRMQPGPALTRERT